MANKKLHIIITGEAGESRSFSLFRNTIYNSAIALVILTVVLGYGTLRSSHYLQQNKKLRTKTAQLTAELQTSTEQLNRQLAEARSELSLVVQEKEELTSSYQQELADLKQDQETLLEGSISRLDERAKVIETVIDQLGVKVKVEEDPDHSGGPYIALDERYCDKLLCNTDRYLAALQKMPLGRPVNTKVSSRFGRRKDPLNQKMAFHAGIDFKGKTGDKVLATGDAVVKKSSYSKGLGNYLVLSHGDGYETRFAHLSKRLVAKGDRVKRGQVIGLVGNTGRSTGSHLHYEVRHYGKAINPMKYLKVAELTVITSKQKRK